jgi:hypothetical protein
VGVYAADHGNDLGKGNSETGSHISPRDTLTAYVIDQKMRKEANVTAHDADCNDDSTVEMLRQVLYPLVLIKLQRGDIRLPGLALAVGPWPAARARREKTVTETRRTWHHGRAAAHGGAAERRPLSPNYSATHLLNRP